MRTQDIALLVLALAGTSTRAGEFVNLDFDSPDLSHLVPESGSGTTHYQPPMAPIAEALRGWSVSWDPDPVFQPPNYIPVLKMKCAPLTLYGPTVGGQYRLEVDPNWGGVELLRPGLHLMQVGTVPGDAVELRYFDATWYAGPPFMAQPPSILINDVVLAPWVASESPYELAVNVTPFAGQEVKLEIYFPPGKWQSHTFDIYGFIPVPEATTCSLVVVGGMVLIVRNGFKRKNQAQVTMRTAASAPKTP